MNTPHESEEGMDGRVIYVKGDKYTHLTRVIAQLDALLAADGCEASETWVIGLDAAQTATVRKMVFDWRETDDPTYAKGVVAVEVKPAYAMLVAAGLAKPVVPLQRWKTIRLAEMHVGYNSNTLYLALNKSKARGERKTTAREIVWMMARDYDVNPPVEAEAYG